MNNRFNRGALRSVLVVGLGYRTGLSVSNYLAAQGIPVTVSDSKGPAELRDVASRLHPSVCVLAGEQGPALLDRGFDLVILSPGVPKSIPLIVEAVKRGVPVVSEIEFAASLIRGETIGITGTDGKSTTTALTAHIFSSLGMDCRMGGNIGIPLISIVAEPGDDSVTVIELSSFQLETIVDFRPDAAAVLNVTPDHLDRYRDMEEYARAKFRITMNQRSDDFFVYNADDPLVTALAAGSRAVKLSFSLAGDQADASFSNGCIVMKQGRCRVPALDTSRLKIMGLHNVQNAMASLLMVSSLLERRGIEPDFEAMAAAAFSFPGLPHRMERIGTYEGRTFINDSKATTVGAVDMALRSVPPGCVLILGGRTKGDDYTRLRGIAGGRAKAVVLMGESADSFSKIFSGFAQARAVDFDEALVKAMKLSSEGDSIVLSPACASFDMFKNYEERGDAFRKAFERLAGGRLPWT
jgi:UDP-N-acetylmuramoylalanine--D-glutamate ligase